MPIGSYSLTYHIADELCKHMPKSVLDLGIGFGLQGALVRQYMDHGVQPWKTKLIGVEAFEKYHNPCWDLYDIVHVNNIEDYLTGSTGQNTMRELNFPDEDYQYKPDFIIMTDVIEHFSMPIGYGIIKQCQDLLAPKGVLLIGTPAVWAEQGPVNGNPYEEHKSLWKWNEFPPGFEVIKNGSPDANGHMMILVKYVKK